MCALTGDRLMMVAGSPAECPREIAAGANSRTSYCRAAPTGQRLHRAADQIDAPDESIARTSEHHSPFGVDDEVHGSADRDVA
jgi:hypothetical protein